MLADTETRIAIVGATDNPAKYGSIIYRDLKRKGYRVLAVNPNRTEVDGDACFPSLANLADPPDIVDIVVPPRVAVTVVREALALDLDRIWLQPGTESPEALSILLEAGVDHIAHSCIMVESRRALFR